MKKEKITTIIIKSVKEKHTEQLEIHIIGEKLSCFAKEHIINELLKRETMRIILKR